MVKKIILVLVVLVLVGAGYVYYAFESLLKRGVELAGSAVLGTAVTVDSVGISPLGGSGSMSGLRIANPEGYSGTYAMELGKLDVAVNVESLLTDVVEIDHVIIQSPRLIYETRITTDNFRALLANIGGGGGAGGDSGTDKKVIIRDFQMLDPRVTLSAVVAAVPVPLPDIHLTDIGDQNTSVTVADAARQILSAINREIINANVPDLNGVKERARDELETQGQKLEEAVENKVEDLKNALRGLR